MCVQGAVKSAKCSTVHPRSKQQVLFTVDLETLSFFWHIRFISLCNLHVDLAGSGAQNRVAFKLCRNMTRWLSNLDQSYFVRSVRLNANNLGHTLQLGATCTSFVLVKKVKFLCLIFDFAVTVK